MAQSVSTMLTGLPAFYSDHLIMFVGSVFIVGLTVGSFVNVVIYRLPIMLDREWRAQASEFAALPDSEPVPGDAHPPGRLTLSVPRSACPSCNAPIAAWHNVPVISWLILRGRCATCRAAISWRYPVVELATGILSGVVALHFGFGAPAACALLVTWMLIALTGIDIDHQLLPDTITLPLLWAGLLAAVVFGASGGDSAIPVAPRDAIVGATAGYLSLWAVFHIFRLVTGKEGMGYGDFKLFAALGAWLGWRQLPLVIVLAAATGATLGMAMIALRGRDRAAPMPFGPYLAAAGWLAMMYGNGLIEGYLRLSGLQP
jgi:leader peptidase (prepilin peptidase)/N-methyltransferase